MSNELKPEDVMKALECCSNPNVDACSKCPIYPFSLNWTQYECMETAIRHALALLREKDEEIDRLKEKADRNFENLKAVLEERRSERAEAITEFAERLKASLNDVARWQMHGVEGEYFIIGKSLIDRIAKEMKEGK